MPKKYRVAFIGDTHNDTMQPPYRIDSYFESMLEDTHETLRMAKQHNCHAYVHLGDLFHKSEPSGRCRNAVIDMFRHQVDGQVWPFEKFIVEGNHDNKNSPIHRPDTALGTLLKHNDALQCTDYAEDYKIGFGHFNNHIEADIRDGLLTRYPAIIWATHATITLSAPINDKHKHILFNDVPVNPECRLIINGHIHHAYASTRADGVHFINPGSISRYELDEDNLNKIPNIVIVDYYDDGSKIKHGYHAVETALPGRDIFNFIQGRELKIEKMELKDYMRQIEQITQYKHGKNIFDNLRASGKAKNIDEPIVELAIDTLKTIVEKE